MKQTVNRCIKKPGLIDRARTYYLELNEKGLYIIAIGKAGQKPNLRQDNLVNIAALSLAKKLNNPFAIKMEEEIVANEERLAKGLMDEMVKEKNSFFLKKNEISIFKNQQEKDATISTHIRGGKLKITLYSDSAYMEELKKMEELIGKK